MNFNNETYAKQIKIKWIDKQIDSVVIKKRTEMWRKVTNANDAQNFLNLNEINNCLDVGTTSDTHYESSNFFLTKLPNDIAISIFSDQENPKEAIGEKLRIVDSIQGSICSIINLDKKFDLVMCSATLEHVGSQENQKLGLLNLLELTNKYLFLTVPNRWHPVEFHSRVPLVHWLPNKLWRKIFQLTPSLRELSSEDNLNFISPKLIRRILSENSKVKSIEIFKIKLLGFTSNFAILVSKNQES